MATRASALTHRRVAKPARRNKYGAVKAPRCMSCGASAVTDVKCLACHKTTIRIFDSKAEARRFDDLFALQKYGQIKDLRCQPRYPLEINGVEVGVYVADFDYREAAELVVEDVKGGAKTDTALFKFKRKCFEAAYGMKLTIVRR